MKEEEAGGSQGSKVLFPYRLWRLCGRLQIPEAGAPVSELRFPSLCFTEKQSGRERVGMLRIGGVGLVGKNI